MRKNFYKIFLFLGGASFLFCGCLATQEDAQILKIQISELNKTLQELQKNQADNAVQMEELIGRLTQATDNLENFEYKINELNTKLDNVESSVSKANTTVFPSVFYAQAKKQFEDKQYDAALQGFGLYLKSTESRGTYAQQAYLNSALIYFEKQDYQAAAIAAATLIEKFPKSSLIPDARLIYAKSLIPLDKKSEAKTYLQSIIQDYPKSKAVKEAKTVLKGIK